MTINYKKTLVFILYSLLCYNTKEIKRILEEVMIDNNEIITDNLNKKESFFISTFGCQMNEEDSEKMSGMLKSMGYEKA